MRIRWLVAAGVALVPAGSDASAHAACAALWPAASAPGYPRPVQAADLLGLRDVGQPDAASFGQVSPFGLSPDGLRAAFIMTRADAANNRSCRGLVVLDLTSGQARLVDAGGDAILAQGAFRGAMIMQGAPKTVTPVWSPNGAQIAFLRRDGGVTRAWIVPYAGGPARPVSPPSQTVLDVTWGQDGAGLLAKVNPAAEEEASAVDREGRAGWLYDERVWPMFGPRPMPSAGLPPMLEHIALADGRVRPATAAELADAELPASDIYAAPAEAIGPRGRAYLAPAPAAPQGPDVLHWVRPNGIERICALAFCSDHILNLWWDKGDLLILRQEGWARERVALYRWHPGSASARRILVTEDALHGCANAAMGLVCTDEASQRPRRIVLVDRTSGGVRPLWDLNPEFQAILLGSVRRLHWRNALGLEARGDLVLPPNYRPGTRVPLIIVQYRSDGFLRGGTGDEYPIYLFAADGMAVLSIEKTAPATSLLPAMQDVKAEISAGIKNWSERRSLLSTVQAGIAQVVALGIADPRRLAITGLSDGATTVQFALLNGPHFAAAAMSTCCNEPDSMLTYAGPREAAFFRSIGYPPVTTHAPGFWRDMSLADNAARISTPLLLQVADSEYLLALQAFGALREVGAPAEMYVFPNEYHEKIQPVHRLAIYERNLDWFRFWLLGERDPMPEKIDQYRRWEAMRPPRGTAISPSNAPTPPRRPVPSS